QAADGSNPFAADAVKFHKACHSRIEGQEAMSRADNVSASSARFTAGRINTRLGRWSSSSRRSPWRRFAPYLGTVLALSLFGGALYLLHHQVAAYDPEDVRKALTTLSWQRIIAALGLTGASYFLLIFYDALALRHIRKTLPFR